MLTLYDLQNALSSPNEEIERFKLRLRIPGEFVHIKQIIQDAIEDPYVQLESIDSVDRIKAFDYLFPQLTNRLIKKIVDHPKTFKKVVTRTRYIKDIYWAFKQHSQVFGSLLLRKPEILDDFLLDYKNTLRASELREVLDYFPMLEDACFQYVLNPSVFNRLVQKRGGASMCVSHIIPQIR